jgi:hypothetical protein
MRKGQQSTVSAVLAAAIGATAAGAIFPVGTGLVPSAQAQSAEERKREQDRERSAPRRQQAPERPSQ